MAFVSFMVSGSITKPASRSPCPNRFSVKIKCRNSLNFLPPITEMVLLAAPGCLLLQRLPRCRNTCFPITRYWWDVCPPISNNEKLCSDILKSPFPAVETQMLPTLSLVIELIKPLIWSGVNQLNVPLRLSIMQNDSSRNDKQSMLFAESKRQATSLPLSMLYGSVKIKRLPVAALTRARSKPFTRNRKRKNIIFSRTSSPASPIQPLSFKSAPLRFKQIQPSGLESSSFPVSFDGAIYLINVGEGSVGSFRLFITPIPLPFEIK